MTDWQQRAEAAEAELAKLDAVVHVLGIEDSHEDPAEEAQKYIDRAGTAEAKVAKLREALEWALPLAIIKLSDTRQMRLQCGHDDINAGSIHDVGLWPEEVAARERARQALTETEEQSSEPQS